jgi:DNA invertase Pin-like site-specific DNA recombinase
LKAATKNRKVQAPSALESCEQPAHLIGYARVSTRDQDPRMQINALIAAGVAEEDIYYETVSGASKRRPQFDAMMKDAREGDVIVFWKLDRLGRSVRQVLDTFARLDAKGAKIRCLTQQIDTSTAMGRLVVTILAAVAEMERELGLERTRAGLARAKAEGRLGGATAKHSDPAILEFAKLGIRPGARAADLSIPGFQKAVVRARKRLAERQAKKSVIKAKKRARR